MSSLDFEHIGTVRVLRDRFSGAYVLHCDFDLHAEATAPMDTVEGAFELAQGIVRDELRARPTIEALPVAGAGSERVDKRISELALELSTGKEVRPVECAEYERYANRMVDLVRLDTGETIFSRPMRPDELQTSMEMHAEAEGSH